MKAGSLQPDDDLGPLLESQEIAILRRSVPRSVFVALSLSAFIYFLTQIDSWFEISNPYQILEVAIWSATGRM